MTQKKEKVSEPELDMLVYHEDIYDGKELMTIVGFRYGHRSKELYVELEGDYSGGIHPVTQRDWLPLKGCFRLKKVCDEIEKHGSCQLHNLYCSYPDCEPYVTHKK